MFIRSVVAVVLGGVAGTVANAAVAGLLINPALWKLATVPSRYALGIAFVALVPALYRLLSGAAGAAVALAFLTLAPSLLAKLALEALTAWPVLLGLNLVYALTALVVYRVAAGAAEP
jgi:hypothetical protein